MPVFTSAALLLLGGVAGAEPLAATQAASGSDALDTRESVRQDASESHEPIAAASPSNQGIDGGAPAPSAGSSEASTSTSQPIGAHANESSLDPYAPDEAQQAEAVQRKSFSQSWLAFRLELGGGAPFSNFIDDEEKTVVGASYSDGRSLTASPSHIGLHFGVSGEVAPLRSEFVKLAIRASYSFTYIGQTAEVGEAGYESKSWNEHLLDLHAALFGPVLYVGKRWYGSFQFLVGPAAGTLTPAPIAQELGSVTVADQGVRGWTLRLGPGFGYAFKKLLVGGDFLYTQSRFDIARGIYTNGGGGTSLHVVGVSGYVGVHI